MGLRATVRLEPRTVFRFHMLYPRRYNGSLWEKEL